MKRLTIFACVVTFALLSTDLMAQRGRGNQQPADPSAGTWTLNVAKSKYTPGPAPTSQTRTIVSANRGAGIQVTVTGTGSDGSAISFSYTANYDGKDNPITGSGIRSGADTIALGHHDNITDATLKKAGKKVETAKIVVSADGRTLTLTAKGTGTDGKPFSEVAVYEK